MEYFYVVKLQFRKYYKYGMTILIGKMMMIGNYLYIHITTGGNYSYFDTITTGGNMISAVPEPRAE